MILDLPNKFSLDDIYTKRNSIEKGFIINYTLYNN